jgi:hypothetical protein
MHIYRFILFFFFSVSISALSAQTAPPAMAMPDKINSALIDSIIKVTNHEQFFIDHCTQKVKDHAAINKWPQSQTEKILKSIQFKYYDDTIYNSYADYSTEELKKLLDVLTILNKKSKSWTRLILTNSMMQNNLDVFVKGLIEGKYVMSSD